MISGCPSACLILVNAVTQERLQIWYTRPLRLEVELIGFWWPEVRGQRRCDLAKHIYRYNSQGHTVITVAFLTNQSVRLYL